MKKVGGLACNDKGFIFSILGHDEFFERCGSDTMKSNKVSRIEFGEEVRQLSKVFLCIPHGRISHSFYALSTMQSLLN